MNLLLSWLVLSVAVWITAAVLRGFILTKPRGGDLASLYRSKQSVWIPALPAAFRWRKPPRRTAISGAESVPGKIVLLA